MEHVEVLRELSEVCRAAIKAGYWKVDGACDPESLLRRADAAIASLSAPQPPAEAQPVGWIMQDKDGGDYWPESFALGSEPAEDEPDDAEWVPLFLAPPPSAPVGVEGCLDRLRQHRSQRLWQADLVGGRISVERMRAILTAALAAQPGGSDNDR